VVYLPERSWSDLLGQETGRASGLPQKKSGLIHLGLGYDPSVHHPDPVFLGGELGRGCQAPDNWGLVLNGLPLLGGKEKRSS
jgi:hypothetical protein